MLRFAITWLGTLASVVGLVASLVPSTGFTQMQCALLGVVGTIVVGGMVADFMHTQRTRPRRYKDTKAINDYMHKWISGGGRTVIFSRDLTWVGEGEIKDMLKKKAKDDDLSICLPKHKPITLELEKEGARVHTYDTLNFSPMSRFTIINEGRHDAKVAIGRQMEGGVHLIEEFSAGSHPVFSVAMDLAAIVSRIASANTQAPNASNPT